MHEYLTTALLIRLLYFCINAPISIRYIPENTLPYIVLRIYEILAVYVYYHETYPIILF